MDNFIELFRYEIDPITFLVVSETKDKNGIWVNEFKDKHDYKGFTRYGFGINASALKEFIINCNKTIRTDEETSMRWIGSESSELKIRSIIKEEYDIELVDLRQFIKSKNYKGFTKKGLRIKKEVVKSFIDELDKRLLQE